MVNDIGDFFTFSDKRVKIINKMKFSIVEIIQAMLAPGLMISACGLFLLGMNNKYSLIVNRIRLLNEEKRMLESARETAKGIGRLKSIDLQIQKLYIRFRLVRNAVFSYYAAVAFFILASLFIGLKYILQSESIASMTIGFFLCGIVSVMIGIIFASIEIWRGYIIVGIEIRKTKNIGSDVKEENKVITS